MKFYLIIGLFFVACANNEVVCDKEPDAIIENVCIYKNQFQKIDNKDLRVAMNVVDATWSEKFDVDIFDIANKYQDPDFNVQVEFVDKLSYKGVTLNGFYVKLLFSEFDKDCIANTAFGHEMLHVLTNLYDIGDPNHKNVDVFMNFSRNSLEQNKNSLENKINIKLCSLFCEEDCMWYRVK